jgi:hypothetical protein
MSDPKPWRDALVPVVCTVLGAVLGTVGTHYATSAQHAYENQRWEREQAAREKERDREQAVREKERRHAEAMRALERAIEAVGEARGALLDVDEVLITLNARDAVNIHNRVAALEAKQPIGPGAPAVSTQPLLALERALNRLELTAYRVQAVAASPTLCTALRGLTDAYRARRAHISPLAGPDTPDKVSADLNIMLRSLKESERINVAHNRVRVALGEVAAELNVRLANGDPPDHMITPCTQAANEAISPSAAPGAKSAPSK